MTNQKRIGAWRTSVLTVLALVLFIAFGTPAQAAYTVKSASELTSYLASGSDNVIKLGANISIVDPGVGKNALTIQRDVTLDLNGYTLTITTSSNNTNGIKIASGKTFTVTDSSKGKGLLSVENKSKASAAGFGAAINCSYPSYQTTFIVDGAKVVANGGYNGAGIGGGYKQTPGTIRIQGAANVTATGGLSGAGIGSGASAGIEDTGVYGQFGSVRIVGSAVVKAQGGSYAAGVGGGASTSAGALVIRNEAQVTATGGMYAAGIGGGYNGHGGNFQAYDNAVVVAQGGRQAAGIGGGDKGNGGRETIGSFAVSTSDAPHVTAKGGEGGPGIGRGLDGKTSGYTEIGGQATVYATGLVTIVAGESGRHYYDNGAYYDYSYSASHHSAAGIDVRFGELFIEEEAFVVARGGAGAAGLDFTSGACTIAVSPTVVAYGGESREYSIHVKESHYSIGGAILGYIDEYTYKANTGRGKEVAGQNLFITGGNVRVGDVSSARDMAYGLPLQWTDLTLINASSGKPMAGVRVIGQGDGKNYGRDYYAVSDANGKVRMWLPERFSGFQEVIYEIEGFGLYSGFSYDGKPPLNLDYIFGMKQDNKVYLQHLCVLSFDINGGEGGYPDYYALAGDTFDTSWLVGLRKPGYELDTWSITATTHSNRIKHGDSYEIHDNMVFKANWKEAASTISTPRAYRISINVNGGEGSLPAIMVKQGDSFDTATIPAPTRKGYLLVGWDVLAVGTSRTATRTRQLDLGAVLNSVTADIELIARWERISRDGLLAPPVTLPTRR